MIKEEVFKLPYDMEYLEWDSNEVVSLCGSKVKLSCLSIFADMLSDFSKIAYLI